MEASHRFSLAPTLIPSLQHYALSFIFPPLAILSVSSGPSRHLLFAIICLLLLPYGHNFATLHALILVYRYYGNSFVCWIMSHDSPMVTTTKTTDKIPFTILQCGHTLSKPSYFPLLCYRYLRCLPPFKDVTWLQKGSKISDEAEEKKQFEEKYGISSNAGKNLDGSQQAAAEKYVLGKLQMSMLESLRDYPELWGCRQADCPDAKIMTQLYLRPLIEKLEEKRSKTHSMMERHNRIATALKRRSSTGKYLLKTGDPRFKFATHGVKENT